jgi:hypothetical protein
MSAPDTVHPHLPRFSQGITGVLCVEAIVFQDRWVVVAAALLVALARFTPRWSPVNRLFRLFARPVDTREPAAPVRFSQAIALTLLGAAIVALFAGAPTVGWVLAGIVAVVALVSAVTGWCCGCEVYRLFMLRRSHDGDLRGPLGLTGEGPWVLMLTAPGCARCEPVARQLDALATREVVRLDVTKTPAAARLPVSSIPAVVVIDEAGHLADVAAGRLDRPQLEAVLAV